MARLLFKPPGGNHIPQQVDHLLALHGHLHLDHGVVEQVTPVIGRSTAHVVRRARGKHAHGTQPGIGIHEQLTDMGKIGHVML